MKLLLLQPPVQDFYDTDIRLQPLGLCYLKAVVKKHLPAVSVIVKDYHAGWGRKTVPVPHELAYLKGYFIGPDESPFSTFHHYYHFGAPFDLLAEDVMKEKPDLVGIASLFSPYYREVLRSAETIKKVTGVPILTGGPHATACPELMLRMPCIDFVIRGEGEKPLVEFLRARMKGTDLSRVPNLAFKEDGNIILNPVTANYPLEELPDPDFSDLDQKIYTFEKRPLSFVLTSRGCPHECAFCSVHETFGRDYRKRSGEDILEEISKRYDEGIRVFDFEDDNLTFLRDDMKAFCKKLAGTFSEKNVRFLAMNGISYMNLDEELLSLLRQAGFTHLNISLVSSEPEVLRKTQRSHTIHKFLEVAGQASRLGFKTVAYQILGLPGEPLDSMIRTLALLASLPVLVGASPFYLTPGSPVAKDFPPRSEEDLFRARLTAMGLETGHCGPEDIYTLFISARIINFLKGFDLGKEDLSCDEVLGAADQAGGRKALGAEILRRLFSEDKLYAVKGRVWRALPKFRADIFLQLWASIDHITTLKGSRIRVERSFKTARATSFGPDTPQNFIPPAGG